METKAKSHRATRFHNLISVSVPAETATALARAASISESTLSAYVRLALRRALMADGLIGHEVPINAGRPQQLQRGFHG